MTLRYDPRTGDIVSVGGAFVASIPRDTRDRDLTLGHKMAAAEEMFEALTDMLAGWRYIRERHGDLYGVGWDRCENAATAALSEAAGESA